MQAQWDVPFSQFWTAKTYYNPSFAGETGKIQVSGIYNHRWINIKDAPKHLFFSMDMPIEFLGLQHGIGIQTFSNVAGNKQNTLFAAQYTFKQKIRKGILHIGVQAGMMELNFDAFSPQLATNSAKNNRKAIRTHPMDKKAFDVNAGISWTTRNFHAGVAAMHLNQLSFYPLRHPAPPENARSDSIHSRIRMSYNFMVGYNINVFHPLVEIQPMALLLTNLTGTWLHTAVRMVYNKKYSAGVSRNGREGCSLFAGVVIKNIEMGYAYNLHTSGIGKGSGGSHEVSFNYRFPTDLFRREPMPYKSIRFL